MDTSEITLGFLAEYKDGTIEDIQRYLENKGVKIPVDKNYVLTPSELKAFDPLLAFKLKFSDVKKTNVLSQNNARKTKRENAESVKTPMPNLCVNNQKVSETKKRTGKKESIKVSTIEAKIVKPIIGVIKFFDTSKDFGFINSNIKGTEGIVTNTQSVCSFYLSSSEWMSDSYPKDNEWVVFVPARDRRGRTFAKEVRRLEFNEESLKFVFEYSGSQAMIYGDDGHGDSLDYNIPFHILKEFINVKGNNSVESIRIIIDSFCDYVSSSVLNERKGIILNLLSDSKSGKLISEIFLKKDYVSDDQEKIECYKLFKSVIVDAILEKGDMESLNNLPQNFDYYQESDKITKILVSWSAKEERITSKWIKDHSDQINIILDNEDLSTIPLRIILADTLSCNKWVTDLNCEWSVLKKYLNQYDFAKKKSFISKYFSDKDYDFIKKHSFYDIIDTDNVILWINELIAEKKSSNVSLLVSLIEHNAINNIDLLESYISTNCKKFECSGIIRDVICRVEKSQFENLFPFFKTCISNNIDIDNIFSDVEGLSDEIYAVLFVVTGNFEYLNEMDDFDSISSWITMQSSEFVLSFIEKYGPLIEEDKENDDFIQSLGEECVTKALKLLSTEERYQILRYFQQNFATKIVIDSFSRTKLFDLYIGEQWSLLKSKLPYVVFDLETDGEDIKEFAFHTENHTNNYDDAGQIKQLIDVVNEKTIVVGHRIKQWDLRILDKFGFVNPQFVWDTLEIEILLNPCRYAYSLHTLHNAEYDTNLTNDLFWNQLFRLSQDKELCDSLIKRNFLPECVINILEALQRPHYKKLFIKDANTENKFFQDVADVDEKLIDSISKIEADKSKDEILIIAPQRLWNRISEYVPLYYDVDEDSIANLRISEEKLLANPLLDKFQQTVLERFVHFSKTPTVSNLAQYLRIQYFNDTLLKEYVSKENIGIYCSDLRILSNKERMKSFRYVYFIGCELENRLNSFSLPYELKTSDFWGKNNSIPMRLGGGCFTAVTCDDLKSSLFAEIPNEAANVWIERTLKGNYIINYNINVHKILENIRKEYGTNIKVSHIPWVTETSDKNSIVLVHSKKPKKFDYIQKRVSSTSRYRAMYWMYQLALLSEIQTQLPKIFIVEDDTELDNIMEYALSLGFNVPREGTLVSKLEAISKYKNGLLVIPQKQFFNVIEKRLDTPYCFIWDQISVEKHLIMWKGMTNDVKSNILNDSIEKRDTSDLGSSNDTYQSIILSIWPVYEYYSKFVLANNKSSVIYIIDSFFEEYHSLGNIWSVSNYSSQLPWSNEKEFSKSLLEAQSIFKDNISTSNINTVDYSQAEEVIKETLIKWNEGSKHELTEVQKIVLPEILSKQHNYLVSIPTGGGKSILFQGPALYNASYNNRLSIVVTPLKALMQDQVKNLSNLGFYTNVDYLNGDRSYQETRSIYRKINGGELALLYVTPERFRSRAFLNALSTRMMHDHGLEYIVFDEAHCISQWGMEFRPEYLNVVKKCREFSEQYEGGVCIAMFSATVTDMIYNQINEQIKIKRLGQNNDKKIYNPIRNHIGMQFLEVTNDQESRIQAITEYIKNNKIDFTKSRMLVFCKTRKQTEEVSSLLSDKLSELGILDKDKASQQIGYFHAGLDSDDRDDTYARFKSNNDPIYILCATKAFGMGMDIPNVHYIVHITPPNVLEDYLQEIGRAGRDEKMYKDVGFNENNPIPTLCLYSNEDIKKSREQLLQNMLSWKNLEDIRKEIIRYIKQIQSLEKSKEYPVVIPNNLWRNNMFDNSFTDFKLGEYWLERLGKIKLGYLSPAHINITVGDVTNIDSLSNNCKEIFSYILKIAEYKGSKTIQVSLQQLASDLSLHTSIVMNHMIYLVKQRLVSIDQVAQCRIANTRMDEVSYMLGSHLRNSSMKFALQIVIDGVYKLLSDNKLKIEKIYNDYEIRSYLKNSESLDSNLKEVSKTNSDGSMEKILYMPWYNENEKGRNKGLSIAKNYKKDLYKKRFRQVFNLLDIIPDVQCRSYIDRDAKCVKQSLLIEKDTWKNFLPVFKEDCLRVIQYIYNQKSTVITWAQAIIDLEMEDRGYKYFESIVRFLNGMAYIVTDNFLPTGVEVLVTDKINDPILDEIGRGEPDYNVKESFDEASRIRNLRLCVMDALTSKVHSKEQYQKLISAYFSKVDAKGFIELLSNYYEDTDSIWDVIRQTAIKEEEEKLKDNAEQWAIYNENSNNNVNVEAGPGSGKTHILTMKCAKLIYREHVNPSEILVLAYNRAVVVELKDRLSRLFTLLGLSRSSSQLNVHTFHGLAKRICGDNRLSKIDMSLWEQELLYVIKNNPKNIIKVFPSIKYILIDEFQDITQTRLDAMFALKDIYQNVSFFTIGDSDQSIYGFEKKESMDPQYYYNQLHERLKPKEMTMSINYRSYPKILTEASKFLPSTSKIPLACKEKIAHEPKEQYTFVYKDDSKKWYDNFENKIYFLKERGIDDVAVFFRTNNEVFNGYSIIKKLDIPNVRIRIQGTSECELYRKREIYSIIRLLEKEPNRPIVFKNDETKKYIHDKVKRWIYNLPHWDVFYMDFAYTLVLDYLEFASSEEENYTFGDMAEYLKITLKDDNPQLYKLYDKYQDERILDNIQQNIILTTMHKVKGLEFDAVIITPSLASLPFIPGKEVNTDIPLKSNDIESIEEEKRLLYVAFTRAKKYLWAYMGEREGAVMEKKKFKAVEDMLGIHETNPGLSNYHIGFNALSFLWYHENNHNSEITKVSKNDVVTIIRHDAKGFHSYDIVCKTYTIGRLSSTSNIAYEMEKRNLQSLKGFFVNDIYYWSYQDTLNADEKNNTNYSTSWGQSAKDQGYIFIVSIAGYGKYNK